MHCDRHRIGLLDPARLDLSRLIYSLFRVKRPPSILDILYKHGLFLYLDFIQKTRADLECIELGISLRLRKILANSTSC
jgi:hypothetical protein